MGDFFDGMAGGLTGGILSYLGQEEANRSNRQMAQYQNEFQLFADRTKYQRTVDSLKDAGLNPMMAFGNMGASSLNGALGAPMQNSLGSAVEAFQRGRSTSADVEQKGTQSDVNRSEKEVRDATVRKVEQETATSAAAELDYKAGALAKASQSKLNSAVEAKTRAEAGYIDAQRAELAAKQPLWNIVEGATKKVRDISNASTAENVKRMRENLDALKFKGQREDPRSITIYGTPAQ